MRRKGVVLVVSLIVLAVMLVLTGVYFSGLITEKRSEDTQRLVLQGLSLAEAGANQGVSELRKRIRTDLNTRVKTVRHASVLINYVDNKDSLGFLRDYAYADGQPQFVIVGNEAVLDIQPLNLNTGIQGNYSATIRVKADGDPSSPQNEVYRFPYTFTIEAIGTITKTSPSTQKQIKLGNGAFLVTARRDNFAKFALFTNHHRTPSYTTVWFTANTNFTGPVHTNERFSFAQNPSAHFSEEATQHETKARFYNNGSPIFLDADYNGTKDVPIFDKGFKRSYDLINLESSLTQQDLKREAVGGVGEPGQNGIHIANDGVNLTGGIYIRGNQGNHADDATVKMEVGPNGPIYTITQSTTTKVVTVDYANNQTVIVPDGTFQGIPDGIGNEGIIIYCNDDIKDFSGTVQKASKVTVSGERDITITNHIKYQEFNPGPPLNALGFTNLLGILSWGGNIRIGTSAPNNIDIHGVVMAPHGIFTVDNYDQGSPRGIATLLGGAITDFYGPFGTFSGNEQRSGYGRNFVYDARMLAGLTPPYFPYMTNFTSFDDEGLDKPLTWQEGGQ